MQQLLKTVAVPLLISACVIVCVELGLRFIAPFPSKGGIYVNSEGKRVGVTKNDVVLYPNLRATHVGYEFTAKTTTNARGYRTSVNESMRPDYLFIGGSFTFGHGVDDDAIFTNVFCREQGASCMNLARSGSNTFEQLRVLRHALDNGMRPRKVVLFMSIACWIDSAGNDLGENLLHLRSQQLARRKAAGHVSGAVMGSVVPRKAAFSLNDLIKPLQRQIGHFEIVRRTMLLYGSRLKSGVYACSEPAKIAAALPATRTALEELQRAAAETPFDVAVFFIHPFQELDGDYRRSEEEVAAIMPASFAYFGTGARFRMEHYFPYDGHFNAAGHANMAAVLAAELGRK